MNGSIPSHVFRFLACVGALTLASCCTAPAPPMPAIAPAPVSKRTVEITWLVPKVFHEEFTYPTNFCSQVFRITGASEMVWIIEFAPDGYSYGAIVFRKAQDLSAARTNALIAFRIKPAYRAAGLRAGLVDEHGVVIDAPVAAPADADDGWQTAAVPLAGFPDTGILARAGAAETVAIFDWSAVREFRLIATARSRPQPVEIRLLRIEKE